ncbi:hypothetical protein [Thalassoroseus pseudoceratinae]|uniref:hypothetical protein n=1 Tax=Thalassoroseus pseudoceratinae TaxID=2713176 RepID=UPI00142121A9|nr:hypothetical protein [Thalassoroseus pseudoceratinae]
MRHQQTHVSRYRFAILYAAAWLILVLPAVVNGQDDSMPFERKIETYHDAEQNVTVFVLRLEQPFLAEEFEKSNYLRLRPADENSWLVYPRQTRFEQKHAEFYGRLRRTEKDKNSATLKLSYETVSEELDGTRRVEVRETDIEIPIPVDDGGPESLYQEWAREQNEYFADLLRFYPENSFLEYVLLQSEDRYGVKPPPLPGPSPTTDDNDFDLYHVFGGGLAVQQTLQREVLSRGPRLDDLSVHISQLSPPDVRSLDYNSLLEKRKDDGHEPQQHALSRFVPATQYFLNFRSMKAANELMDLSQQWGDNLLRTFQVSARDHHLREKYEDQLAIRAEMLGQLFDDQVVSEFAVTGSDFYIAEGTDVTLLFQLEKPDRFRAAASSWLDEVKAKHAGVIEQEFNYRGHRILARYTPDRTVSSFVVFHEKIAVFSNSHRAIRRLVDTMAERIPNLSNQADYQYVTTMLTPQDDDASGYLYCSEAFLKRLISPEFKIAEKRRRQAFSNLVMLNNASLFYRLEHGESPQTLSDLAEGNFVDMQKVVDPSGGAYAYDAQKDTATSSLYNRIKYLTPIIELNVLKVSQQERQEYQAYQKRYESYWRQFFDPIAVRLTSGPTVKLETLVLPFANGSLYSDLRHFLSEEALALDTSRYADPAILSLAAVPGRKRIGELLRSVPGVPETLDANPTLTDLSWLGDRVSLHFCDDDTILEIDPTRLKSLGGFIPLSIAQQAMIAAAVTATNLPVYLSIEIEDEAKAQRLLKELTSRVFLHSDRGSGLTTNLDAYRLPDYKQHPVYVFSLQVYVAKVRLHMSLVGGNLIAATDHETLRQAIDATQKPTDDATPISHALMQVRFTAMKEMQDDLQLYWAEKARQASQRNIMPLYTLIKLYDVSVPEANQIADAKYGVTYFDPGGGKYVYDEASDQVLSTTFGNRQNARQNVSLEDNSPFADFFRSLIAITVRLRYEGDGLLGTIEIQRTAP